MSAKLVFSAWLLKKHEKKKANMAFKVVIPLQLLIPFHVLHFPVAKPTFCKLNWYFAHRVPSLQFSCEFGVVFLCCPNSQPEFGISALTGVPFSWNVQCEVIAGFLADYVHVSRCLEMFGLFFLWIWQFVILLGLDLEWSQVKLRGWTVTSALLLCSGYWLWMHCKAWSKTPEKVLLICLNQSVFKKQFTSLFITLGPKHFSFQLLAHPPKQLHIFCCLADRNFLFIYDFLLSYF